MIKHDEVLFQLQSNGAAPKATSPKPAKATH
jgi:hypothetical protein